MSKITLYRIFVVTLIFLVSLSPLAITDVKAQAENSWTSLAPLKVARRGFEVATVNKKIYVIGGISSNLTEEYDPATNTWTTKTAIPTIRTNFGIAVYQNKIYCIGGTDGSTLDVTEVYDPQTDTWTTGAPMPSARQRVEANTVGDTIYVVTSERLHYAYDPQIDTWTRKANMIATPGVITSVVFENKIHVFSSPHPDTPHFHQIYDPEVDSWSQGEPLIESDYYPVVAATTGVFAPKKIYLFGMSANNWYYNIYPPLTGQSFDPNTGNWTKIDYIPKGHLDGGAAVIDDRVYLIGGVSPNWLTRFVTTVKNDMYTPLLYGSFPQISISSLENMIYTQTTIPLEFSVNETTSWTGYSLDGQTNVTLTENTNLTGLAEGTHTLRVFARDMVGDEGITTITFTVDTLPPIITFLSPQNQSYTDANVTLSVNLNEAVSDLKYSLDGLENVTFAGNATLSDFEYGEHNIVVYATDLAGHAGVSETIHFTIEPFPTTIVLSAVAVIAVVGIGIFVYFKKRRS